MSEIPFVSRLGDAVERAAAQRIATRGRRLRRRLSAGALGLVPLPAGYDAARARVTAFSLEVMAIERSEECIDPPELARRVQALLHRSGWTDWRTVVRDDLGSGPCAEVSSRGGNGVRSIEGSLFEGQVLVVPVPASAAPGAADR